MRASLHRQTSHGFTLIEVVLALSIFALMGAILYGAFSLSHSAVEKSQASFERNQKLRSFTDLRGS
jgi:prepilin-type N-terminal cleavage/methylation domain-containing protein